MDDRYAAGALAERNRIASILNHPATQGREALAKHLALSGSLSSKAAIEALEAAPKGVSADAINAAVGAAEARRLLGK